MTQTEKQKISKNANTEFVFFKGKNSMRPGAAEAGPELPTDNALGGGAQGHGLLHTNNPGNKIVSLS